MWIRIEASLGVRRSGAIAQPAARSTVRVPTSACSPVPRWPRAGGSEPGEVAVGHAEQFNCCARIVGSKVPFFSPFDISKLFHRLTSRKPVFPLGSVSAWRSDRRPSSPWCGDTRPPVDARRTHFDVDAARHCNADSDCPDYRHRSRHDIGHTHFGEALESRPSAGKHAQVVIARSRTASVVQTARGRRGRHLEPRWPICQQGISSL